MRLKTTVKKSREKMFQAERASLLANMGDQEKACCGVREND